jgi:hypothetical protein
MTLAVAHIRLGAPGQSGPPIVAPIKVAEDLWSVPPGFRFTDEQYASFKAGDVYVNIQSPWHKAGEIRAQLKPSARRSVTGITSGVGDRTVGHGASVVGARRPRL